MFCPSSLWMKVCLGKGLEGCPYHLLHPFVSLVILHSCIYNWKKNGKCVRIMILAFKAERKNWEEVLQELIPLSDHMQQHSVCHCPKLLWWMSPSLLLHAYVWSPWIWKLLKTDIFSQSGMWAHLVQAHWGLSSLYTFGLGSNLEQPCWWLWYKVCEQVPSLCFKYATVDSLGLYFLGFKPQNQGLLFPFLYLFNRWSFTTPPHKLCLSPECIIYWKCPCVDAFPYLGFIILYSSLNPFWVLRRRWSKVVVCCGFLQKLQGEFLSILLFKSPMLIFFCPVSNLVWS